MNDRQEDKEFKEEETQNTVPETKQEETKVEKEETKEKIESTEGQKLEEEKPEKAEKPEEKEKEKSKKGLSPEEEEKIRQALRDRLFRDQNHKNFSKPPRKRGGKFSFAGLLFLVFIIAAIFSYPKMKFAGSTQEIKEVSYTTFIKEVENNKIKRVEEKDGYILGYIVEGNKEFRLTAKEDKEAKELIYKTRLITNRLGQDTQLVEKLVGAGLDINALDPPQTPFILNLLASSFPFILLIGLWFFMFRGAGKGGGGPQIFSVGKSKAKENGENITQVSFADVAGIDEAKHELQEVVEFLREPEKFRRMGAKIPKGVLLLGSPGTGKTLLAKAVAGEAKVPFFSMSGSEFVEMFVGVGASRVRDLFSKARKNAPCIVFIDEIDAVGRKRGSGQGGGNDEREQTLNQLLVEMDGFGTEETIIVLAATNRPDVLDRALKRPGRFDRQVTVDAPDVKGRQEILAVHVKNKKLDSSVDLKIIAKKTVGMVGADLANLLNEAAILAARNGREAISMEDLEEASEKVVMGPEKRSKVIPEEEKRLVAYHEVGHAIVNHVLGGETKVHKITMIPRGMAGGYTMSLPIKEKPMYTKKYFLTEMAIFFGGRAAEEIIFGKDYITAGASSDIERATSYAQLMVTKLGMTDKFGPVLLDGTQEGDMFQRKYYSEQTGKEVDDEIRKIINECYQLALKTLMDYREKLEEVTKVLLEKETIMGDEFETLMKGNVEDSPVEEEKIFTNEE